VTSAASHSTLDIRWDEQDGFAFSAAGRPLLRAGMPALAWRYEGEAAWRWERAAAVVTRANDAQRIALALRLGPTDAALQATRLSDGAWTIAGEMRSATDRPVELARLHYIHGVADGAGSLFAPTENRLFRRGEPVAPHQERLEQAWASAYVQWPRLADPIHVECDWAVATDCAILLDGWDAPGLACGFTGPGEAFGEIGLRCAGEPAFYLGARLDNILLRPGEARRLEEAALWWGDWQAGMRWWAERCVQALGARPIRPPLVGWCSWYQHWHQVRPEHVRRAAREFAAWPIPPGGRTIQIDDGFQVMPGDWGPNDRFRDGWAALPGEIAATGSIPGLWLAPTTVFHRHPIAREHPEWLQCLPDGRPAVQFSNWGWCDRADYQWGEVGSPTYFLDPDHPGARAFMAGVVADAVKAGWKYLKIDFTYGLSTARRAWDRSKTALQTLRGLYQLFREAAGPETILCACIGEMGRFALGHADTARLGGDIGGEWSALTRNLPEFLPRLCVNGAWWNGDPDVFYMRSESSRLTPEESWLLTGTIGAIGGVYLTSDFASQWDAEAARRVGYFWNARGPRPPAGFRTVYGADGVVRALRVTAAGGRDHCVAVYNWDDSPRTVRASLADLHLPASARLAGSFPETPPVRLAGDCLVCEDQPPHSLRVAEVRS
jgi:hypothetical protein